MQQDQYKNLYCHYPNSLNFSLDMEEELKQADGTLVELANRLEEVTEEVKNLAKSWEKKYR